MIEQDKRSTNRNNKSLNQLKAGEQEGAFEEMIHLITHPIGPLKPLGEKTRIIKHPVSTGKKKKEPDFAIIEKEKRPVIVEVKSSMNVTKKIDDLVAKYRYTSYENKKAKHLVIVSYSDVPEKVIDKVQRFNEKSKNFKITLLTPKSMDEAMNLLQNEKRELQRVVNEKKVGEEQEYELLQRIYKIEGYEKAYALAKDISERNARQAEAIRAHRRKIEERRNNRGRRR